MTTLRLAAIALVCAGCQDPSGDRPPPALPPAVVKPAALVDGARPQHMRNCPSAVPSAKTSVTATPTSVDILITAPDPDARRAVLARARYNAQLHEPRPMSLPFVLHTGFHTGTGRDGFCPVIHAGAAITVEGIPGGVLIHERPYDPGTTKALYDAVSARIAALQPNV
jgi:hypothetical protein